MSEDLTRGFRSRCVTYIESNEKIRNSIIDTLVEYWHEHEEEKESLREFLGMTHREFNILVAGIKKEYYDENEK